MARSQATHQKLLCYQFNKTFSKELLQLKLFKTHLSKNREWCPIWSWNHLSPRVWPQNQPAQNSPLGLTKVSLRPLNKELSQKPLLFISLPRSTQLKLLGLADPPNNHLGPPIREIRTHSPRKLFSPKPSREWANPTPLAKLAQSAWQQAT